MPRVQQTAQGAHQLGDVVKVQTGGGFVKQEQHAFAGRGLLAARRGLGRIGQITRQLQALRLATAQGGHRLTQAHIVQAHVHDGLQGADDLAVMGKHLHRFADSQGQDIGHVQKTIGI